MSLYTSKLNFLTLRPSIHEEHDRIVIKTGFLTALFSLFLNTRKAELIPSRKQILLSSHMAYFFTKHHQITFDDVWYLDYSFDSMGTEWGWTATGIGRHDQVETYTISIVTKDEKKYSLCAFRGEGSTCTGWTGVLLGDDEIFDLAGTQDSESRKLAQYLASLLDVSIGKPLEAIADMTTCPACGRPTSPYKSKCLYCGAQTN